jgi:hypothetical protein
MFQRKKFNLNQKWAMGNKSAVQGKEKDVEDPEYWIVRSRINLD